MKRMWGRISNFNGATHVASKTFLEPYKTPIAKNLGFGDLNSILFCDHMSCCDAVTGLLSWVSVLGDPYKKRARAVIMEPGKE